MSRFLALFAALTLIIASGVVHGFWTDRWTTSFAHEHRAAELKLVPKDFGEWQGEDSTLDPRTIKAAGLSGYLMRRYANRNGDNLMVLIVSGPPGPISVHTPEVCYAGSGYEQISDTSKESVASASGASSGEFWEVDFEKPGPVPDDQLRILYSWTSTGDWKAPENPRIAFAGEPTLYKMYVVRAIKRNNLDEDQVSVEFLKQFLPELRKVLYSTSESE